MLELTASVHERQESAMHNTVTIVIAALITLLSHTHVRAEGPFVVVLGVAQDGGVPQAGARSHRGWDDPAQRRSVVSLAVVDPDESKRWLIECTPDFKEQLHRLDLVTPADSAAVARSTAAPARRNVVDGIFLTHAHMGHYTGLMHLGHEAMGAQRVPVYVMPRMRDYLAANGPWSQLVRLENIALRTMAPGDAVSLSDDISVEPFAVPHRQEYSEVVGLVIKGPRRRVLFIPDIDSWRDLDETGVRIEDLIADVDVAYVDGTFFANGEIPGRDMSSFPHPFIQHSMERFEGLPAETRAKIRFIHFNHTNPVINRKSQAYRRVIENGFRIAEEMERVEL
jgi:pyrroloquinoline quinone biosynthesis protein B